MDETISITKIPQKLKLDLWAKVIIAKDIQKDEPILGTFDEYGEPVPYELVVKCLQEDEVVECIDDFKITFDQDTVVEDFICNTKVIVTIPFKAFFWIKTNKGYKCLEINWVFKKTILLSEFKKLDGTPLTQKEFKDNVDQSKVVVKDFKLEYVNILDKDESKPNKQIIEVIISATIIDKLGKFRDVIVCGYIPNE